MTSGRAPVNRRGLTQKQETFCLEYFRTGHATNSALVAHYSPRTAQAIAAENLSKPLIQARLAALRKRVEDASIMTQVEIEQRLSEIARARLTDVMKNPTGSGALKSLKVHKVGEHMTITDFELHDPVGAMRELNKMRHIYEVGSPINIDNRQLVVNVVSPEAKDLTARITQGERT